MTMMMVKVVLLFFMLAMIKEAAAVADFDYMQLVQRWPPSVCDVFPCVSNYPEGLIIHGLWPDKLGSGAIPKCTGDPFDDAKIASLVPELDIKWQTLTDKSNRLFWKHEWDRHGKCTGFDIFKYFRVTLDLYDKFDLTKALADKNIKPGTTSTPADIAAAIKAATGFNPIVQCKEGKTQGQVLYDVSVCYNKDATALHGITPGTGSTPTDIAAAIKDVTGYVPTLYCKMGKTKGQLLVEVSLCYNKLGTAMQDCTDRPFRYCNEAMPLVLAKK